MLRFSIKNALYTVPGFSLFSIFYSCREIFIASDGGELALDWYDTEYYNCHFNEDTPILLIIPGYSCMLTINLLTVPITIILF